MKITRYHFDVIAKIAIISIILTITTLFLLHWRIGFLSDNAMIGLMAKGILDRGEHPIFVWSVGYQGILLEAHAVALSFKVFGLSPITLNLFSGLCFLVLLTALYHYLKLFTDKWTALLTPLFVAMSNPAVLTLVLRTMPNYTETYLFGILLFILNYHLLEHFYIRGNPLSSRSYFLLFAFGFVSGFATYTYRQILYFFCAIGLQYFLIYFRTFYENAVSNVSSLFRWKLVRWITGLLGLHFIASILLFALDWGPSHPAAFSLFGVKIKFHPLAMIQSSIYGFISLIGIDILVRFHKVVRHFSSGLALTLLGFIIGFSPELYFILIQKGKTANMTKVSANLPEFTQRIVWGVIGILKFINLYPIRFFTIALIIGILVITIPTLTPLFKIIRNFSTARTSRDAIQKISPIYFMPLIALLLFSISSMVFTQVCDRYIAVLVLPLSFILCSGITQCFCKRIYWKILGFSFFILMVLNNAIQFNLTLNSDRVNPLEDAIRYLKTKDIHYGYAGYALAYLGTFLAQEEIIIEPTTSNYNPAYGPLVQNANRIAYFSPEKDSQLNEKIFLKNSSYLVIDRWEKEDLKVLILEKVPIL